MYVFSGSNSKKCGVIVWDLKQGLWLTLLTDFDESCNKGESAIPGAHTYLEQTFSSRDNMRVNTV